MNRKAVLLIVLFLGSLATWFSIRETLILARAQSGPRSSVSEGARRPDYPRAGIGCAVIYGVLVTSVASESAAEAAGLRPGDFLVKAGRDSLSNVDAFTQYVDNAPPGSSLELFLRRFTPGSESWGSWDGPILVLTKDATPEFDSPERAGPGEVRSPTGIEGRYGAWLDNCTPRSPGERAGLSTGDVLTDVNGKKLGSGLQLVYAIDSQPPGSGFHISLLRAEGETREWGEKQVYVVSAATRFASSDPGKQ